MAASWSQQEHCCDCGYVPRSPSLGPLKLGLARPASAGGCRAVKSAAYRPLSADVNRAASHSAYRPLSADVGTPASPSTAYRPLSADVGTAASFAAYRPMPADVMRAASLSACRALSADVGTAATPTAGRPVPADMKGGGKANMLSASAVGLDGAVGDVLSQSMRSAAALTPVTQEQQGYKSPLSHLQQSFKAELGVPTSFAARIGGPMLEAGQDTESSMAGRSCFLDGSAEVVQSAAAAHLVHQGGLWSHDTDQQLEVSPETSFLQMLDQCQQTDPDSLRVQLDPQQQTDTSFATMGGVPDFAKHSGCQLPQPADAVRQQQRVKARVLGSSNALPQATAVVPSAVPASTAAAADSSEAYNCGLAAILDDISQDSSTANAAAQLLQQDELCQLGAIIADKAQSMRPRPLAGSFSQLFGVGMPPHLQSAPHQDCTSSGLPSEVVTVAASGREDRLAGHAGFHTPSVAADTSAAQAMSLPAVSAPDLGPCSGVAWQLGTHMDNAQQPALQPLSVMMAQCSSSSQGVPVSSAEPGLLQQQQQHAQRVASAHAEIDHQATTTDAVDVGVETDHRWLLGTAWAEQRQWIAARRRSGEADAKWELDESGSISGNSEGSVSSESTLRPSSVGRCRVNCGRNAKVVTALAR